MKIIKGNKDYEMNDQEFDLLLKNFNNVIVDIGTGDGRFIYKQAINNPNNLYIGVDPSQKQLEIYSKESNKKRLNNILFVVGSIEQFPIELFEIADKLYINLPWGSLLQSIVNPTKQSISTLSDVLKPNGELEITLGYHDQLEPNETERLNLPTLDEDLIKEVLYPAFEAFSNLQLQEYNQIDKDELKNINSTWAKKLVFGSDRPLFRIEFTKEQ